MLEIWEIILFSIMGVAAIALFIILCGPVLYACFCADNRPRPPTAQGQMLMAQMHLWHANGVQGFYAAYGRMPTYEEMYNAWKSADPEQQARLLPYLAQYGINPQVV